MRQLVKKITSFFICAAMVAAANPLTAYARPDWPSDTGIMADAGIVMDADSGTVLFGQNIHVPLPPASITKLLTALVVAEHCELDEIVTFSHDAVYNLEEGAGNKLALEEGDQISVEDCLHMMLLLSSNQSANALAEHVAGSRDGFVDMMNEKIKDIGCAESHFANPSGLNDPDQNVSAYDMALISAAAFKNETVLRISSTKRYSVGPTINNPQGANISMEHRILMAENSSSQYYCNGATAGKTGYTSLAGNTLVTYAQRDGRNLISVILKGSQPQYYLDAKTILNFGFASFKNESLKESETFLQEIEELEYKGTAYPVSRLRLEDTVVTLPAAAQFSDAERTLAENMPANRPAAAVGMLVYTYNERKVGSAYIYDTDLEAELAVQASREAEEALRESREAENEPPVISPMTPEETLPQETGSDSPSGLKLPVFRFGQNQLIMLAGILAAVAVAGVIIFITARKKKRERMAREIRRERRRQRLQEIGYSEEDFEALVRKRQEGGRGKNE